MICFKLKYGSNGRRFAEILHSISGVSIREKSLAHVSVHCEKYSRTPQYSGASSNRARTTSAPGSGATETLDWSKYFASSGVPQLAQRSELTHSAMGWTFLISGATSSGRHLQRVCVQLVCLLRPELYSHAE